MSAPVWPITSDHTQILLPYPAIRVSALIVRAAGATALIAPYHACMWRRIYRVVGAIRHPCKPYVRNRILPRA